jgi:hypothetical protein
LQNTRAPLRSALRSLRSRLGLRSAPPSAHSVRGKPCGQSKSAKLGKKLCKCISVFCPVVPRSPPPLFFCKFLGFAKRVGARLPNSPRLLPPPALIFFLFHKKNSAPPVSIAGRKVCLLCRYIYAAALADDYISHSLRCIYLHDRVDVR